MDVLLVTPLIPPLVDIVYFSFSSLCIAVSLTNLNASTKERFPHSYKDLTWTYVFDAILFQKVLLKAFFFLISKGMLLADSEIFLAHF